MTGHYSLFYDCKISKFSHKKEHVHVKFIFKIEHTTYPHNIKYLYYSDPWRWSNLEFASHHDMYKTKINKIGKSIIGHWIITEDGIYK